MATRGRQKNDEGLAVLATVLILLLFISIATWLLIRASKVDNLILNNKMYVNETILE